MTARASVLLFFILFPGVVTYGQQCGAAGAPTQYFVRGRVIAPGADFGPYHEVLQLDESRLVGFGYTGSDGEFKLPGQPPGTYYLVVRIDGFKEYRQRIDVDGCDPTYSYFVYMEPEEEVIRPVILDFTGEVNETVDVAELKRVYPRKVVAEFEHVRDERLHGERDQARVRLEKLLLQYPDFYDGRNALGSVYLEMKRFRDAEGQFNKARELKPNSAAPLVSLGSLYVQEAEASVDPEPGTAVVPATDLGVILDDALDVLGAAIKIKPDAAFAYYLMGIAYTRSGAYTRAEENLHRALQIEPRLRWSRIALGNLYINQSKWQQALSEFDTYLTDYMKASNRHEVEEVRDRIAARLAREAK